MFPKGERFNVQVDEHTYKHLALCVRGSTQKSTGLQPESYRSLQSQRRAVQQTGLFLNAARVFLACHMINLNHLYGFLGPAIACIV